MSEPLKVDYLDPFIEATTQAAARFRRVLIVVIIASTFAFSAFWNATSWSWLNSRINVARNAEAYLTLKQDAERLSAINDALNRIEQQATLSDLKEEEKKKLKEDRVNLTTEKEQLLKNIERLQGISKEDLHTAEDWLNKRGMRTTQQLKVYADRLEMARVDNIVLVRIPFFGVVLDVNDLGALGGFTFVVILLWFRFSLWREYYNLSSTFKEAKSDDDLEFCYKALSMSQVLTVPPAIPTHQPKERPWGKVVRILYFLPVTVQLVIFIYDCRSFNYGWDISQFNTVFGFSMSLCFLVLSALLTYWCFRLSSEIDKEWDEAAKRIRKTRDE